VVGAATTAALAAFQRARGLPDDGRCDDTTWSTLVEAGYSLGDRILLRRSPMLRGDDIAELQRRLSALGFHSGRVDGIFGPDTHHAVQEFQRNAGLVPDGICGNRTVSALQRLGAKVYGTPVAVVRERLVTALPRHVSELTVGIGSDGSMTAIARQCARSLRLLDADVTVLDDPDLSVQAAIANQRAMDLYIGFAAAVDVGVTIAYYGTDGVESPRGRAFAELLESAIRTTGGAWPGETTACRVVAVPRATPILRETRMPAVWISIDLSVTLELVLPVMPGLVCAVSAAWGRGDESLARL
jgi:N-acetylmuramoyl-L-alanine amidase